MKLFEALTPVIALGYVASILFVYEGKVRETKSYPWTQSECIFVLSEIKTNLKKNKDTKIIPGTEKCTYDEKIKTYLIDDETLQKLNSGTLEEGSLKW